MGSTECKGCSLQLNQIKLPNPQRLELLTRIIQVTTMRYKKVQYTQDIQ
jgi:hypothetical protein